VSLCCVKSAVSNVFACTPDANCLVMRLVASGVCAVRVGTENTNDLERLTCSIGTSSLHAVLKLRLESSKYSRHTPSFGRQGEFKPVGVARTLWLRLSHTSLRAASRQRGVARMPTERTRHTWHPELSIQCGAVDTCDVPLYSLLQKPYPDQLARIYEAGPVQALCR
jgi:hypothetical protein